MHIWKQSNIHEIGLSNNCIIIIIIIVISFKSKLGIQHLKRVNSTIQNLIQNKYSTKNIKSMVHISTSLLNAARRNCQLTFHKDMK